MSKKHDEDSKEGEFKAFVSSAIRAPRQGVYEHLLSQFLASAVVVSDPLKRIKIVTEAAMMVPKREREDLTVNYKTVDVLNTVCIAFQNRMAKKDYWLEKVKAFEIVIIPWGFPKTEENFKKYIAPWYRSSVQYFPLLLKDRIKWHTIWICWDCDKRVGMDDEKPRKCPRCGNKLYEPFGTRSRREYEVIENPRWSWFFDTSRCLSMSGYLKMKNEFVSYAIPKVQLMLAELTRLVQPSLYVSMLNYTKKRSYAEKIAEVSKATTPSEEPLDQR